MGLKLNLLPVAPSSDDLSCWWDIKHKFNHILLNEIEPLSRMDKSGMVQCSPFIKLCFVFLGMDHITCISELCYKGQFYKGIIGK